jgi:hypothetical protein
MREEDAVRVQVRRQVAHWRTAAQAISDLDSFAAPAAWAELERYLDTEIRRSLQAAVARLHREMDVLDARLKAAEHGREFEALRRDVVAFRKRFLLVEDVLEFYGTAVNSRTTPKLAATLRGCDELARLALESVLVPLGRPVPPVLCFVKKGLGASILRASQRLWDGITLNPAAVVKVTRHNICSPTAVLHEAGHQAAAELGWAEELAAVFERRLAPASPDLATVWASWSSEIVADVFAFVLSGYGSVAGLHDVVAGDQQAVFRFTPGDPHPIAYLRVLLGTELCTRCFGLGPWDELTRAWVLAHPLSDAPPALRPLIRASVDRLAEIADICLRARLRAFRGRSIIELIDPRRVSPTELAALERRLGTATPASPHWLRIEGLRLLALSSYRSAAGSDAETKSGFETWLMQLGGGLRVAA